MLGCWAAGALALRRLMGATRLEAVEVREGGLGLGPGAAREVLEGMVGMFDEGWRQIGDSNSSVG